MSRAGRAFLPGSLRGEGPQTGRQFNPWTFQLIIGWALYDGTGRTCPTTGDSDEPPYATGVAALCDGWRLIQAPQLIPPYPGHEYDVSFLKHEFFFEKFVDLRDV
ncbi:hypothetical protein GCM10010260_60750 [Streptomyces filipinensis]|uniref:Uncharacterized protein n=1 Tax=Streptomyces filipinensis TaxID=66887 RepID=A0A918IHG3_9ACTN|nr:hypothetical protein GCM10010260_60750 [Streptomyces filipinensis]